MESTGSSSYIIYRPEKLKKSHILDFLLPWRTLNGSGHVEISHHDQEDQQGSIEAHWMVFLSCVLQKILLLIRRPLSFLGFTIEFTLNLFSVNGGILNLIANVLRGSLVIPNSESVDYRSFLGHIDERIKLHRSCSVPSCIRDALTVPEGKMINDINPLELCMMASKVAYENPAYVKNAVTEHWKMHFVGFYNCWNEFLKAKATQAFIFCDQPKNAELIVVAFRGTETFNAIDWCTDLDLSWLSMGKMGRVHLGFMKALGLQDEKDHEKGWPKDYTGDKELAYYVIRDKLKALLKKNKNAKIMITGHSLGAALAVVFPAVLTYHQEDSILNSLFGVYTFGQPRVGDKQFGNFMETQLNAEFKRYTRYIRVVYRYDIVPRVPFDDPFSQFVHFGGCLYYNGWYKAQVLDEEPDDNYFSPLYLLSKHFNALLDLSRALYIGFQHGKEFTESLPSIFFRLFGLLVPGVASHSPRDSVNAARLGR